MLIVLFGTFLLTASKYKEKSNLNDLIDFAMWNSLITGFITTFMMSITLLSNNNLLENQLLNIALNFRPLFYSSIIYLLLSQIKEESGNQLRVSLPINNLIINEELLLSLKIQFQLTQREYEVVSLLVKDNNSNSISSQLTISESTAKKHISNIYKKCGVSNKDQLRILISSLNQYS